MKIELILKLSPFSQKWCFRHNAKLSGAQKGRGFLQQQKP